MPKPTFWLMKLASKPCNSNWQAGLCTANGKRTEIIAFYRAAEFGDLFPES